MQKIAREIKAGIKIKKRKRKRKKRLLRKKEDCLLGKTVPILFLGRNWSLCVLFCSTACNTGHGHVSLRNVVGTVLCIFEIVYVGSASDVKYKPNTAQTSFAGTELQEFFISV